MKKKEFLIYNDTVLSLYTCTSYAQLQSDFLPQLRLLIPFSYASFVLSDTDPETGDFSMHSPVCFPDSFKEAEEKYCNYADRDGLLWLVRRRDCSVIKESNLIPDEERLHSFIYQKCYSGYPIYDTLQDFIVWHGRLLGILTLFRTVSDELFTEENLFYLRSLSRHLNVAMNRILKKNSSASLFSAPLCETLAEYYHLSPREKEILKLLCRFRSNAEIAISLGIRESTVQKHLQNLFHKCGVTSRWELMRLLSAKTAT